MVVLDDELDGSTYKPVKIVVSDNRNNNQTIPTT